MSHDAVKLLSLAALALTFASLVLLMIAAFGVPWDKRTLDGASPFEIARKRRQYWTLVSGTACGGLAILLQAVLTLYGP